MKRLNGSKPRLRISLSQANIWKALEMAMYVCFGLINDGLHCSLAWQGNASNFGHAIFDQFIPIYFYRRNKRGFSLGSPDQASHPLIALVSIGVSFHPYRLISNLQY
jgi:hypothetical protein